MPILKREFHGAGQVVETYRPWQFGDIVRVARDAGINRTQEDYDTDERRWLFLRCEEDQPWPFVMVALDVRWSTGPIVSNWGSLDGFEFVEGLG